MKRAVIFDQTIDDQNITFVVIVAQYKGKWLFCKHKDRITFEVVGGRREARETIWETAHRELFEESGATEYELKQISPYRMKVSDTKFKCGMLFYAEIKKFTSLPDSEIQSVHFFDEVQTMDKLTYPNLQHDLMNRVIIELEPLHLKGVEKID
jgi:8-oxo-dGTP diphosphatase